MSARTIVPAAVLLVLAPAAAAQSLYWSFGAGVADFIDKAGHSVAVLPDGVATGHHAVLVGAPFASEGQTTGRCWRIDAEDATGYLGATLSAPGWEIGWAVAALDDVNGDGRADIAAGMPGNDFPMSNGGGVAVCSGTNGAMLYLYTDVQTDMRLGETLASVGDIDGDGRGDFLAGAPGMYGPGGAISDPDRGYAVLISGIDGSLIDEWYGLSDRDALGAGLAGLGDLDYDGVPDFAIGVPGRSVGSPFPIVDAGVCHVYSGGSLDLLVTVSGTGGDGALGSSVCKLGDRDNDGSFEFAVGAPGAGLGTGQVRVYEGLQATLQMTLNGTDFNDFFGAAVSPGGDVDQDGHDDLIVTATRTGSAAGYARVYSGADWSVIGNTITGPANSGFGANVAGGFDTTGDGWPDAFFGLPLQDTYGTDSGGARGYEFVTKQQNLGFQGPGPTTLEVYGTPLSTGGHADLLIEGLPPSTVCYLLASLVQLNAPFKGGVLVPHPAAGLLMVLPTGLGTVKLQGLPGGGGPFSVYLQALAKQPSAPKGWWMSNAVKVAFLP